MSMSRLRVFHSVAKNLSFTKAAKELCITQPAITKHIAMLEDEYQVKLFDRIGNKIKITQAGKLMLEHVEGILQKYNEMSYDLHRLNSKYVGRLRIGASTTIAQYVLPSILVAWTERFPDIDISLYNENSSFIEKALLERNIDVGLVENISRQPNFNYTPFLEDDLVVIAGAHNKKVDNTINKDTFVKQDFVMREYGSGTLEAIEVGLEEDGIRLADLNVRMYMGGTEGIKLFVQNSDCLGIVSRFSVAEEVEDKRIKIVDVRGLKFNRHFSFVESMNDKSDLVAIFKSFIKDLLNVKASS